MFLCSELKRELYIYIYIYIYREREREREILNERIDTDADTHTHTHTRTIQKVQGSTQKETPKKNIFMRHMELEKLIQISELSTSEIYTKVRGLRQI